MHHYGIEFGRIQYSSHALRKLFADIGGGQELAIRNDPTDICAIGVIHPADGTLLIVSAIDENTPPISFHELILKFTNVLNVTVGLELKIRRALVDTLFRVPAR
ncbi:hypothetical protein [Ruegeria sp. Alg231-54]|uniref:hypothetical protein n=1 Tax=Ruegeria sp. Alg231-54 TaxID=1922221 RepID=UPI000D5596A9